MNYEKNIDLLPRRYIAKSFFSSWSIYEATLFNFKFISFNCLQTSKQSPFNKIQYSSP